MSRSNTGLWWDASVLTTESDLWHVLQKRRRCLSLSSPPPEEAVMSSEGGTSLTIFPIFQQFSRSGNGSSASSRWQNENRPLSDDKQTFPKKNPWNIALKQTTCSSCASSERKWQRQTKQSHGEQLRSFSTGLWHHAEFMEVMKRLWEHRWSGTGHNSDPIGSSDPIMLWTAAFRTRSLGNNHYI